MNLKLDQRIDKCHETFDRVYGKLMSIKVSNVVNHNHFFLFHSGQMWFYISPTVK